MTAVIDFINGLLWGPLLIPLLLGIGVLFSWRLRLLQIRRMGHMFSIVLTGRSNDESGISPFQALCTSLASRVGTGNLAGVAVAIYLGGAGAIFWMWITALLGMATGFAESTLAQLYKVKDDTDTYRGGPAYYLERGLGLRWLGQIFAVLLIIAFGFVFNAVQSNSIADAMHTAFGINQLITGVLITLVSGLVIFGGIRSIAAVAEKVVPVMALAYLLLSLGIMLFHLDQVPVVFGQIISSAFGLEQAAGGVTGGIIAALLNGVKRGLFSNEAGMGSAPNAAASATPLPHHPASQGFVQSLGVFIDTIVICSCTAFIILLSGVYEPGNGVTGIELTQQALDASMGGYGSAVIAIAILFFAFTSIIGNYMYAESNVVYLMGGHARGMGIQLVRLLVLAMVMWGSLEKVGVVWDSADAAMGMMALVNLVGLLLLSGVVVKLTRDYEQQLGQGKVPHLELDRLELPGKVDKTIWTRRD